MARGLVACGRIPVWTYHRVVNVSTLVGFEFSGPYHRLLGAELELMTYVLLCYVEKRREEKTLDLGKADKMMHIRVEGIRHLDDGSGR